MLHCMGLSLLLEPCLTQTVTSQQPIKTVSYGTVLNDAEPNGGKQELEPHLTQTATSQQPIKTVSYGTVLNDAEQNDGKQDDTGRVIQL